MGYTEVRKNSLKVFSAFRDYGQVQHLSAVAFHVRPHRYHGVGVLLKHAAVMPVLWTSHTSSSKDRAWLEPFALTHSHFPTICGARRVARWTPSETGCQLAMAWNLVACHNKLKRCGDR